MATLAFVALSLFVSAAVIVAFEWLSYRAVDWWSMAQSSAIGTVFGTLVWLACR